VSEEQIVAALIAILTLAGVARWMRLGESRIDSAAKARSFAEERLAGFVADTALVSSDGTAAIVAGNGGIALLKRRGAKVAARRLIPPLILGPAIEGVRIESGDPGIGSVVLLGVVAEQVRELEASQPSLRGLVGYSGNA